MIAELLVDRLLLLIPLWLSLAVHEWAHAFAADRLGDDSARLLGRMTLDPLAHLDPLGTVILPLLGVPFGWAKPVPVNPARFRVGVPMLGGLALVAAAGPLANFGLAALAWAGAGLAPEGAAALLLGRLAGLNLALGVFNLLPVPPLDGSRVVDALAGDSPAWRSLSRVGAGLLAGLLLLAWLASAWI